MLTSCWSLDQLTSAEGSALTGHSSLTVDPALCSTSRRYPTNTRGAAAATHTDMRTPVQNATARLITGTRRSDHTSPVLRELHWLLIGYDIYYGRMKSRLGRNAFSAVPVMMSLISYLSLETWFHTMLTHNHTA